MVSVRIANWQSWLCLGPSAMIVLFDHNALNSLVAHCCVSGTLVPTECAIVVVAFWCQWYFSFHYRSRTFSNRRWWRRSFWKPDRGCWIWRDRTCGQMQSFEVPARQLLILSILFSSVLVPNNHSTLQKPPKFLILTPRIPPEPF